MLQPSRAKRSWRRKQSTPLKVPDGTAKLRIDSDPRLQFTARLSRKDFPS